MRLASSPSPSNCADACVVVDRRLKPPTALKSAFLLVPLLVGCGGQDQSQREHTRSEVTAVPQPPTDNGKAEGAVSPATPSVTAGMDAAPVADPSAGDPDLAPSALAPVDSADPHGAWPPCDVTPGAADEQRISCSTQARVKQELAFVAKPRQPGSPHWKAVQDRCASRFEQAGFTVQRVPFATERGDENEEALQGTNVIGTLTGTSLPDHVVLVGAHYDHIADCDGADDNGSGVAALLVMAETLGREPRARTIVVACWDQEETGLHGSFAHVENILASGQRVDAAFVFDTMGVRRTEPNSQQLPPGLDLLFPEAAKWIAGRDNRGDFVAVLGNTAAHAAAQRFVALSPRASLEAQSLELPEALIGSPVVGDLHRSDHANFWLEKMPALMLTDTANFRTPTYHCRKAPDTPESVDPAFIASIAQTTTAVVLELASQAP